MKPPRLATVSRQLMDAYTRANDRQRRRAVLDTCLIAITAQKLSNDNALRAIDFLKRGECQPAVSAELAALSSDADDRCFALEAKSDQHTEDSVSAFRDTRIFAALSIAMDPDTETLHEALYEAIVACGTESKAIEAAQNALKS